MSSAYIRHDVLTITTTVYLLPQKVRNRATLYLADGDIVGSVIETK